MKKIYSIILLCSFASFILVACASDQSTSNDNEEKREATVSKGVQQKEISSENATNNLAEENANEQEKEFNFEKPESVRGLYVTGHSAGEEKLNSLIALIENTDLNAMVIDIKDDFGNITYEPDKKSPLASFGKPYIKDPKKMLKVLKEHNIYPIARIVVFKDSVLADEKPEFSFKNGKEVWRNGRDEAFVNPFQKDVWEHNLTIAKEAAEMGFAEIQFDYVRFPEGFENKADNLDYDKGDYENIENQEKARVQAVTDFVTHAKEELEPYDVDISVDVFGYTVTVPSAGGIGQDIVTIGEKIDVLSSMIYPSHWGDGNLDVTKPDLDPYQLIHNYAVKEKEKFLQMDTPPISRPWIQDFTASWLGEGNYKTYGKEELEAQIRALNEAGIDEFLLWNAANNYTENVDYTPELDEEVVKKVKKADKELQKEIEQKEKEENEMEQKEANEKASDTIEKENETEKGGE
ncbi:putative glycoside hydrolase [Pseudogracilibacillus sp. SO30301A]|uniref:putative glycoside hydrolase n=1 Tax=Pseudogracilibacillus sp. SO30301A TaxID=3098291 RepID=UPI003FA6E401